eukprot:8440385-Pyramimonas_sp.AAC.1
MASSSHPVWKRLARPGASSRMNDSASLASAYFPSLKSTQCFARNASTKPCGDQRSTRASAGAAP